MIHRKGHARRQGGGCDLQAEETGLLETSSLQTVGNVLLSPLAPQSQALRYSSPS